MKRLLSITLSIMILCSSIIGINVFAAESTDKNDTYAVNITSNVDAEFSNPAKTVNNGDSYSTDLTIGSDFSKTVYVSVSVILGDGTYVDPIMISTGKFEINIPKVTSDVYITVRDYNVAEQNNDNKKYLIQNLKNVLSDKESFVEMNNSVEYVKLTPKENYKISEFRAVTHAGMFILDVDGDLVYKTSYTVGGSYDLNSKEIKKNADGSIEIPFVGNETAYIEAVAEPIETEPTTPPKPTNPTVKKTTVNLQKASAKLYIKESTKIKADVKNGVGKTTYKSGNKSIAKVDSNGKVTALKKGTAKITVTNNKVSKTFTVTVKKPFLNKTSLKIKKGAKFTLKVTGKVGKAKFITSNKKIAAVNQKGKITAKKKGNATVTVKTNGIKLKCKVKVK